MASYFSRDSSSAPCPSFAKEPRILTRLAFLLSMVAQAISQAAAAGGTSSRAWQPTSHKPSSMAPQMSFAHTVSAVLLVQYIGRMGVLHLHAWPSWCRPGCTTARKPQKRWGTLRAPRSRLRTALAQWSAGQPGQRPLSKVLATDVFEEGQAVLILTRFFIFLESMVAQAISQAAAAGGTSSSAWQPTSQRPSSIAPQISCYSC